MLQASGYILKTMTVSSSEFLISMVDKWEVLRRKKQKLIFKELHLQFLKKIYLRDGEDRERKANMKKASPVSI